ncbi:MAG: VCBS repeat-containing protein [Nitrospirae bacterium]|nr:VCBS repeat-containing protein [Nitrospirota bacterium]
MKRGSLAVLLALAVACEQAQEAPIGPAITVTGPSEVRNGDRVVLTLDLGLSGLAPQEGSVQADFSAVDTGYAADAVTIQALPDGRYEVGYILSQKNTNPDGTYPVRLVVRVGGAGTFEVRETYALRLINTIPQAGNIRVASDSSKVSAFSGVGTLLAFEINANSPLLFRGVELEVEGSDSAALGAVTRVFLYQDVDGDHAVSEGDIKLGEIAPQPTGEGKFRLRLVREGEGEEISLSGGATGFVIAVEADCAGPSLSGRSLTLKLTEDGVKLRGPKGEKPDFGGLPLTIEVKGVRPLERLWTTDLGIYPSGEARATGTDVNLDGREELMMVSAASSRLWLLEAPTLTRLATHLDRLDLDVGAPEQVVYFDVDSDGVRDAILTAAGLRGPYIALSSRVDSNGRPFAGKEHPVRENPGTLLMPAEWTDVDADGLYDFVGVDLRTATILTAKGRYDATKGLLLTPLASTRTGLSGVIGVAAVDYDQDGVTELVFGTASLLEGALNVFDSPKKDGRYEFVRRESGLPPLTEILGADLDGDAAPEIIALSESELRILEMEPEGLFQTPTIQEGLDAPERPVIGHLNTDGIEDLVFLENGGAVIRSMLISAALKPIGMVQTTVTGSAASAFGPAESLAMADLDGNGTSEVVALTSEKLAVYRQSSGHLSTAFVTDPQPDPVAVGLISERGRVARVHVSDLANKKIYAYGLGSVGNLLGVVDTLTTTSAGSSLGAGPLTGGTVEDLAVLLDEGSVLLVRGDTYQSIASLSTEKNGLALTAADLDGDGRLDLAHVIPAKDKVTWFLNSGGAFTARSATTLPDPEGQLFLDVDGDGKKDLLAIHPITSSLSIALGDPATGSYGAPMALKLPGVPSALAAGDTDGDGKSEVIVGTHSGHLLFYNPAPGSAPPITLLRSREIEAPILALQQADLDADGRGDLLAVVGAGGRRGKGDELMLLKSLGGGRYCRPFFESVASGAHELKLGDLDGDGAPDAVVAGRADRAVEAYRNTLRD